MLDMTPPRRGLHLGEAAIHEQFRSRDVAAVVGCEKQHGLGDLLWCAGPADRNTARRHLQVLLGRFGDMPRGCVDEARAHGVDANAAILQVRRPCPCKRAHGGLGGVVHAPLRRSYTARDGRIQDDRGTIGHQWKRLLHREQEALHVDVEDRVEVLLSDLAQGRKLGPTGIREDNIQLGLLALDVCEEPIKIAEVRHVALETADISSAASSRSRRPVMKTYAPSFTNSFAVARPMPLLPPVMSAVFPSSLPMTFSLRCEVRMVVAELVARP